jgi:hypothetical protein
VKFKTYP